MSETVKTYRMHYHEAEELLCHLAGLSDDQAEDADTDDLAYELFDCEFEVFLKIAERLLPLATVFNGAISGQLYQGFAENGIAIVKREIEDASQREPSNG